MRLELISGIVPDCISITRSQTPTTFTLIPERVVPLNVGLENLTPGELHSLVNLIHGVLHSGEHTGEEHAGIGYVAGKALMSGLIEVLHDGEDQPDTYLLEIVTYPEARVANQVMDDIALSWLGRHVLPEVVVLFLYPKRNVVPVESIKLNSRQGCTTWDASWQKAHGMMHLSPRWQSSPTTG